MKSFRQTCYRGWWLWLICGIIPTGTLSGGELDTWPDFRGQRGDGVSLATGLPLEWSEKQNVRWKTAIPGTGWSSPVILGGQIWVTTAAQEGHSLRAICIAQESGKILHDRELFKIAHPLNVHATNSHASPSPVIEPGRVYVNFGTNGTACLHTATGQVLWTNTELKLDHEVGPGSSPVLYRNLLILTCDGYDVRFIAALDKGTGKVVWKKPRPGPLNKSGTINKAFSTPLLITVNGKDLLVSPSAQQVVAYEPLTGNEAWLVKYPGFSNVPRPIFVGGLVVVCTGFGKPEMWALRPDGQGDVSKSHVAWKYTRQVPAKPSPVAVGDCIYFTADSGLFGCVDARTGRELWRERCGGPYSASPLFADGRLYFSDEKGTTYVLQPGTRCTVLRENHLEGRFLASPAVVGKALYLRTDTHLYRIER